MERFVRFATLGVLFWSLLNPAHALASSIIPISISGDASIVYDPVPLDTGIVVSALANDPVSDVELFVDDAQINSINTADLTLNHQSRVDQWSIEYSALADLELSPTMIGDTTGPVAFYSDFEITFTVTETTVFSLEHLFDGRVGTFAGASYELYAITGSIVDVVEPDGTTLPGTRSSLGASHRGSTRSGTLDGAFGGVLLPGEYGLVAGLDFGMGYAPEPSDFSEINVKLSVSTAPEPSAAFVFVAGALVFRSAIRRRLASVEGDPSTHREPGNAHR